MVIAAAAAVACVQHQLVAFSIGQSATEAPRPQLDQSAIRRVIVPAIGRGTGFRVKGTSLIVTNAHVVQGGDSAELEIDGVTVPLELRVYLPEYDIAILSPTADSRERFDRNVGELELGVVPSAPGGDVFAAGYPELGFTLTKGVVTGLRTYDDVTRAFPSSKGEWAPDARFLQTDCVINPGNSGGPLLDATYRVLGINTWASRREDVEHAFFAMSVDHLRSALERVPPTPIPFPARTSDSDSGRPAKSSPVESIVGAETRMHATLCDRAVERFVELRDQLRLLNYARVSPTRTPDSPWTIVGEGSEAMMYLRSGKLRGELRGDFRRELAATENEMDRLVSGEVPLAKIGLLDLDVGDVCDVEVPDWVELEVFQVLSDDTCLVSATVRSRRSEFVLYFCRGFDVSSLTDGAAVVIAGPVHVPGTYRYTTLRGSTRTVLTLAPATRLLEDPKRREAAKARGERFASRCREVRGEADRADRAAQLAHVREEPDGLHREAALDQLFVRVESVKVCVPEANRPESLVLVIRLRNPSPTGSVQFRGWDLAGKASEAKVTDSTGKVLDRRPFLLATGHMASEPAQVSGGSAVEVVLLFDIPAPDAQHIELRLDASAVGASGTAQLLVMRRAFAGDLPTAGVDAEVAAGGSASVVTPQSGD